MEWFGGMAADSLLGTDGEWKLEAEGEVGKWAASDKTRGMDLSESATREQAGQEQ